jgi:hypothetical protein
MRYQDKGLLRYRWLVYLMIMINLLSFNCTAKPVFHGLYSDEVNRGNLESVEIVFWDWFPQKEEVERHYDSIVLYYHSTGSYTAYSGAQSPLISVGYIVGKKGADYFVLGKVTPTAAFDAHGNILAEIPKNETVYGQILGLSGDLLEDPLSLAPVINDAGLIRKINSFIILRFDFELNSLKKFILELD